MNNCEEDCERVKAWERKVFDAYWEYYRKIEPQLPGNIKKFNPLHNSLHDCLVLNSGFVDKDFYMDIDSNSGFCSIEKLIFINAEILGKDSNLCLDNAYWLYNKIYLRGNKCEIHIRLTLQNSDRVNISIAFDDIIIEGNWETDEE